MSPQVKVTWEEATKWIFRCGIGLAGLGCVGGLKIFNEVRDDVKTILINQSSLRQQVTDQETVNNRQDLDIRYLYQNKK